MSLESSQLTQLPDRRPSIMRGKAKERWMELCAQAAKEKNTDRLIEIVQQINRMLEEEERCSQRAAVSGGA
jgi:hypothetical protein